jgi:uncharacterized membrane protein SpoIIM required for sporulation
VDIDAYVVAHRQEWDRLEELVGRAGGRLTGAEADELVDRYSRVATQLSVVRSASPDPTLVSQLSSLVARARAAVTGVHAPAYREAGRFLTVVFPAAVYRALPWWVSTAAAFSAVAAAVAAWVAVRPDVRASVATEEEIRRLVEEDFERYYSSNPAASFAAQVWTNNAWVAALSIAVGVLILPVLWILLGNAVNVGVAAGLMGAHDRLGLFFGLILPHGLLELTAVFVAAGAGLRLGWSWIDPGPRTRAGALGEEGRAAAAIALGLVPVLLLSGVIEAFVTPSAAPTWARLGVGIAAEVTFLGYVAILGRRAVRAGERGDLSAAEGADLLPSTG